MPAEALIPIERPTGLHRYVLRPNSSVGPQSRPIRIHQQQWSVVDFTTTSNGIERLEWRDVPLVEDEPPSLLNEDGKLALDQINARRRRGLPDYEKPPLGQPPAFLQEQEPKVEEITLSDAATKAWNEPGKARQQDVPKTSLFIPDRFSPDRKDPGYNRLLYQLQASIHRNAELQADIDGLRMRLDATIKDSEIINDAAVRMRRALQWIANVSPSTHPASMVVVAKDALNSGASDAP